MQPQQGVPVYAAAPAPQQTVVVTRQGGPDPCYMCCCPPCAIMSVEGCSPMALVCWAACLCGFWPWNGFCALCYEPQQPTTTVIQQAPAQPGYVPAQPAVMPVAYPAQGPPQGAPGGYPAPAPAPVYGAPPPPCAPAPGPPQV
eukprot:TRINITY_DN28651_c0_g1_i1.p1 TRINITY_DN28651_c0_g1~~TRINITY_DN28651_c0_g1_i1.p1  ORF type:complete len:143 (+),score=21.98 TRINITY_DN28651_c0_g1_i1:64-492(+)